MFETGSEGNFGTGPLFDIEFPELPRPGDSPSPKLVEPNSLYSASRESLLVRLPPADPGYGGTGLEAVEMGYDGGGGTV